MNGNKITFWRRKFCHLYMRRRFVEMVYTLLKNIEY